MDSLPNFSTHPVPSQYPHKTSPTHETSSQESKVEKVEPSKGLQLSRYMEAFTAENVKKMYLESRRASSLAVRPEGDPASSTGKTRKRPIESMDITTPVDRKVLKVSVDKLEYQPTHFNIANQHPKDENDAAERNKILGYLDGRLDRDNHGPLIQQGNSLHEFCREFDESIKGVLEYLQSLEDFKNFKDDTGSFIGFGFSEYSNTQEKHNPNIQSKSVARFSTPKHLQKLQEKNEFLPVFSVIKEIHPELDILMVDILRQDFREGGNGATDFSWHQDTASLDNPEGLDIKRTFILKLTEGESAMQIAGKPITNYGRGAGSWIDFHAGAFHRSIVVKGTCHYKIVCFLGNKPDSDIASGSPGECAGHALKPSRDSDAVSGDGERFTLYQSYKRSEIQHLSGDRGKPGSWREGVKRVAHDYYLFVNLKKDEKVDDRLRYKDYFEDSCTFHWQSQNQTSHSSSVGQRFINHRRDDYSINLFVRKKVKDRNVTLPFMYIGKADYLSSTGGKPMNIIWKLHNTVPPDIFKSLTHSE
ncbi:DUF3427 domain-containing protein [Endozoicomonas atrinae]|uniref:DUF3427 domain-containing protein n=1 Tax=Endozoicomonas atrinae TaxID=1333660 RepID=UPI003B003E24